MEQSSLFGDGVDIDTETPATAEATAPTDARAQAAARAAELRHELDYHAYRYYMLDAPEITDAAFDKMLVELQEIEATYPDLVTPDSYTQRVGGYVSEQFTPVTHMARMYSMDDAMDLDELAAQHVGVVVEQDGLGQGEHPVFARHGRAARILIIAVGILSLCICCIYNTCICTAFCYPA